MRAGGGVGPNERPRHLASIRTRFNVNFARRTGLSHCEGPTYQPPAPAGQNAAWAPAGCVHLGDAGTADE